MLACKTRNCLLHINILENRNDVYHIFHCQTFECHVCFLVIRKKLSNRMMYDCDYKKYHSKTKFIEYVLDVHLEIEIILEIFEK